MTQGDEQSDVPARPRRFGLKAGIAVGLGAVLLATALVVPPKLADRLADRGASCRMAIRTSGDGAASSCPSSVSLSGVLPGHRKHAHEVEWEARYRNAGLATDLASMRDLDANARDAALRSAGALASEFPTRVEEVVRKANQLGAHQVAVDLATRSFPEDAIARAASVQSAATLGDGAALTRFAGLMKAGDGERIARDLRCLGAGQCSAVLDDELTKRAELLAAGDVAGFLALVGDKLEVAEVYSPDLVRDDRSDPAAAVKIATTIAEKLAAFSAADPKAADKTPAPMDAQSIALGHAGWAYAVNATVVFVARGQLEDARRAFAIAQGLARHPGLALDPLDLRTAGLWEALDPAQAPSWYARETTVPANALLAALVHAEYLAEAGKVDEALARLGKVPDTCDKQDLVCPQASILLSALHSMKGDKAHSQDALTIGRDLERIRSLLLQPHDVASALAASPDEQRRLRWAALGTQVDDGSSGGSRLADTLSRPVVLPALLYVLGQLAGKGDVETWLDAHSFPLIRVRRLQHAREVAARWRGDAKAADEWKARAARLDALIGTDPLHRAAASSLSL